MPSLVSSALRTLATTALLAVPLAVNAAPASADSPYPKPPAGQDPYDYRTYNHTTTMPNDPDLQPNSANDLWKYTSKTACDIYSPTVDPQDYQNCRPANNADPQELHGVTGASVDKAWTITTGRPDVVIANTDSGIKWDDLGAMEELNNKVWINRGELPVPNWGNAPAGHAYDADANGQFDIRDYCPDWHQPTTCGGSGDSRVIGHDINRNTIIDPEDLIFLFSDGVDADGNGYQDDIAGWDAFEHDNDPFDEPQYGHGTGEAKDSTAEANNGVGSAGTCPNCRIMVLRAGDSFIADVNDFAAGVLYAVDNGASLIQSALGTLNNSRFAQQAINYAYKRGVVLIASAADEAAAHHNQPSALEHAVVMNSIGEPQTEGAPSATGSYLQIRGCTNVGAYIAVSVPSNSCSSEATGRSAGMAGLAYSSARNAMSENRPAVNRVRDYGLLDGPGGVPTGHGLSAEEVHQLITMTADDINVVTPVDKQDQTDTSGASQRYPSTAGWDPFTGYGRINSHTLVRAVNENRIPPEASIDSPRWYSVVDPSAGAIQVNGFVAARRAAMYSYTLQWAPWSWRDTNAAPQYRSTGVTLTKTGNQTAAYRGLLATIDPAVVKTALDTAAIPFGGKGTTGPGADPATGRGDHENRQIPDKFGVILRLVVTAKDAQNQALPNIAGGPLQGVSTKDFNLHHDPALFAGYPRDLQGDGAAAPRFADLNNDGKDDLIVATSNGLIHAYKGGAAAGVELAGWPAHTTVNQLAYGARAYTSGEITTPIYSATLRPPAIGDLNRDGELEVVVPDFMGRITAFDRNGNVLPGFPVRDKVLYSAPQPADRAAGFYASNPAAVTGRTLDASVDPDVAPDIVNRRGKLNRTMWWFLATPSLGDIDPTHPGLEIVAGSGDRHLYVWHADGTPMDGWPVMLRDPSKVASVDPVTHEITQPAGVEQFNGAKIVVGPAIGDLTGDGKPEIVATVNEQYAETPNTSDPLPTVTGQVLDNGNDRVYALHADGAAHGSGPGSPPNGFPNANAFLPGWPARIATAALELLPVVGDGPTGAPVLGPITGDPKRLDVGIDGTAGPAYILGPNGVSIYGRDSQGRDHTLRMSGTGSASNSTDKPSIPAAGGGIFTQFNVTGPPSLAIPAAGLGKLLDLALPEDQINSDNQLSVYDTTQGGTRSQLPAFPREVNDLQFLLTPSSADIDGDDRDELLVGTAYDDVHAFSVTGTERGLATLAGTGWPKFTGGWTVVAPGVGDFNGDGQRDIASTTREGNLFVWRGNGAERCSSASWPEWGHDGWNTNNFVTDATRPAPVRDLSVKTGTANVTLRWSVTGDDGTCGTAAAYDVRWSTAPITSANFAAAHQLALTTSGTVTKPRPAGSTLYFAVRALDGLPAAATAAQPVNVSAVVEQVTLSGATAGATSGAVAYGWATVLPLLGAAALRRVHGRVNRRKGSRVVRS
ncbi:MAG: hypothetical protein QOG53_3569 [Frankiales bacterium]|jgi:hypothetical protein|nr:hypothetical protein [Frankiales bacterium]